MFLLSFDIKKYSIEKLAMFLFGNYIILCIPGAKSNYGDGKDSISNLFVWDFTRPCTF